MRIDYWALNKITINNNYPLLRIDDLFDRLNRARYFSRINLKFGYYHIHIADGDMEKTTMKTHYGSYEFLMMPFGFCNAPSTFTTLMNSVFHDKLDKFLIIYIDYIHIYFKSTEKHIEQLKYVLQKLKENHLYVNKAKSEFVQMEMDFLGHVLSPKDIRPDQKRSKPSNSGKSGDG